MSEQDGDDAAPPGVDTTQTSRPTRRRTPEESQRRILDAAERAFALRGFGGARLRDIAQEAGVHHALVHHYFGDKRGLLEEVTRRGLSRISDAALTALDGPTTLDSTVRAFVAVLFDFCANNRNLLRIIEDAFRNREWASFEIIQQALGALAGPLLPGAYRSVVGRADPARLRRDRVPLRHRRGLAGGDGTTAALGSRPRQRARGHDQVRAGGDARGEVSAMPRARRSLNAAMSFA